MTPFDYIPRTRIVFGEGSVDRLGELAREAGFIRTLLVADRGLVACGHVGRAAALLAAAGIEVVPFHEFDANPDEAMIETGRATAAAHRIDSIVGFGGGSSMDCAKGINFVLSNGGRMRDYQGYGRATQPMLPMLAVPTTAGTGSEAQSYAVIADATTHLKMACGDPGAAFRIAVLDPALTVTQPAGVTAATGYDALTHAVETYVTTRRTPLSDVWSRAAWRLLEPHFERVLRDPADLAARTAMQLGACYAGLAIEHSMLGATHACANPLTARYGTPHGAAVAVLLPAVVRWNAAAAADRYADLVHPGTALDHAAEALARRLGDLAAAAGLPRSLREIAVPVDDLPSLAADAAGQWTGRFNPRPFDAAGAQEIYTCAF